MATRAFLLCGDEKAVQAVTQILDELEVSFEHSSEPSFSLKRLSTQRFDLLIVDCDNVQNATQVFNSARASQLNKTSIAIAIVEGKAGVPNAFRLGASLVLTKPVSLEQARNTVRTGIGMTRKEAETKTPVAAAPAATPVAAPGPSAPVALVPPAPPAPVRPVSPAVLTPVAPLTPATADVTPKITAPAAPVVEKPIVVPRPLSIPTPPAHEHKPALSNFTDPKSEAGVLTPVLGKAAAAAAGATPAGKSSFDSVFNSPVATEEAADKKSSAKPTNTGNSEAGSSAALSVVDPLAEDDALDPVTDHGVPSFGGLGKQPFAGVEKSKKSSGGKGPLIAALVVLLLAGGGYGAWLTQPGFRKLVAWEYLNLASKIAAIRGQNPTPAAAKPVAPTPVPPVQAAPQSAATANLSPADDAGAPVQNAATPMATATTTPGPSANPQQSTATTATDSSTLKTAAVQSAKQDTTPNHSTTNPSLVPASASLPSPASVKPPSSDLLEVPEDFADDQVVHRVHPVYPKQARIRKLHGAVVLEAIVNKRGKVDSLQLISGDPLLAQAAADAVKQWRYKPYSHNGEPTDFQTRVTVDFKLP